ARKFPTAKAIRAASEPAAPTMLRLWLKNNSGVRVRDVDAAMAGQVGHLAHAPCHTDRHGLQGGMQPDRTQPYVRDDDKFEFISGGVLKVRRSNKTNHYFSPAVWRTIHETP